jgi:hypothetical protein
MSVYDGFTCTEIWSVSCGLGLDGDIFFQTTAQVFDLDVGMTTTFCAWPEITLAATTGPALTAVFEISLEPRLLNRSWLLAEMVILATKFIKRINLA